MNDVTNSRYRYMAFKGHDYRRYIQTEDKNINQGKLTTSSAEATPVHGSYGQLLFDPRWRMRREQILQRDRYTCIICSSNQDLQVHHRQYQFVVRDNQFRLPWEYHDHLLITLCERCHKRGHSKYKVPTINQ